MAVWKAVIAGIEVVIRNVDHEPPHCHVFIDGRDAQIHLFTLEVLHPPPHAVPTPLRRGLGRHQDEMIRAWDKVTVIPPGSSPGVW
jgi:hypothetical protein